MASPRPQSTSRTEWHHLDADGQVLGRLATQASRLLQGKHRADFAGHQAGNVYVVVTNASKVRVSGSKESQKMYRHHTGYPGHLKERPLWKQRAMDPTKIIQLAVAGMLPKNNLRSVRLRHLKVYAGSDHPHMAQIAGKAASQE